MRRHFHADMGIADQQSGFLAMFRIAGGTEPGIGLYGDVIQQHGFRQLFKCVIQRLEVVCRFTDVHQQTKTVARQLIYPLIVPTRIDGLMNHGQA